MPPLLIEQEALVDDVVGKTLPAGMVETMVAVQRFDARFGVAGGRLGQGIAAQTHRFAHRFGAQLKLFPG